MLSGFQMEYLIVMKFSKDSKFNTGKSGTDLFWGPEPQYLYIVKLFKFEYVFSESIR
jgi:hypothetical protein